MKHGNHLLVSLVLLASASASPVFASQELIKKARCVACHTVDAKRVGPAYRDVAEKYKGQADADARLFEKIRKGGSGTWGAIPMPPNGDDKISDEDLKAVVQWILAGAGS